MPPDADFEIITLSQPVEVEATSRAEEPPEEVFYTDGACTGNGKPECRASWAVLGTLNEQLSRSGIVEHPKPSNQVAELTALLEACKIALAAELQNIVIVTDSKYAATAMNKWFDIWVENGWKDNRNKPVVNEHLLKQLLEMKKKLNITCIHVKGHSNDTNNIRVDEMARNTLEGSLHSLLSIASKPDIDQNGDPEIEQIAKRLEEDETLAEKYTIHNQQLFYLDPSLPTAMRKRLFVPANARRLLIRIAHDDPIYGGHLGVKKTRIKLNNYYWPKMSTDIERHIIECETCQKNKRPKQSRYGLLQPIEVSKVFERVHIDIIGPIKTSEKGNRYIITAIDAFSRWAMVRARPEVHASDIIEFIEEEIICQHGVPEQIVSDNGTQFVSRAFDSFVTKLGIKHSKTCDYHPEANGMDERFNGSIIKILRNYINETQTNWCSKLKWALMIYNSTTNESTKISPYTILFGRTPRTPLSLAGEVTNERIEVASHEMIRRVAALNMQQAQESQKRYYDKSRRQQDFEVFDMVLVKSHAPPRGDSKKLAPVFSGPHMIVRIIQHNEQPQAAEILDMGKFKTKRVAFQDLVHHRISSRLTGANTTTLPGEIINEISRDITSRQIIPKDGNRVCPTELVAPTPLVSHGAAQKDGHHAGPPEIVSTPLASNDICSEDDDHVRPIPELGLTPAPLVPHGGSRKESTSYSPLTPLASQADGLEDGTNGCPPSSANLSRAGQKDDDHVRPIPELRLTPAPLVPHGGSRKESTSYSPPTPLASRADGLEDDTHECPPSSVNSPTPLASHGEGPKDGDTRYPTISVSPTPLASNGEGSKDGNHACPANSATNIASPQLESNHSGANTPESSGSFGPVETVCSRSPLSSTVAPPPAVAAPREVTGDRPKRLRKAPKRYSPYK